MYTFAQPLTRALSTAGGSCAVICQDMIVSGGENKRELREPHWAGQQAQVSGG